MFDDNFIEQLKSKNDIVEVVSAYASLEKKGGAFWACCPLPGHIEKTPSFCVNPQGQFYKCFGCQRGGNVIKFIMEMESLDFVDAVKFLAKRANMELPVSNFQEEEKIKEGRRKKERLYAVLKETAHFYVRNLKDERAVKHVEYLKKRGLDEKAMRIFGLGASLDYNTLPKFLLSKGYSYDEMLEAGVVAYNKEKNEYSDFQGKRLIIPIIDNMKNVIAFGGRVLEKTDFAKYKNTSETSIFVKNRSLYNINNLKNVQRQGSIDFVIMVEGYMDVIALYLAGFTNVVASMGTSLTQQQAKMLKRYTDTVVISYDGDSAGQKATIRGLEILKEAGLTVKIISLPDGLDPDDFIKLRGADAYMQLIQQSDLLIDYKLEILKNKYDLTKTDEKRKFVEGAIKIISECERSFEQDELLKQLSKMSGIAYEYLRRDLEKEKVEKPQATATIKQQRRVESAEIIAERFLLCSLLLNKSYASVADVEEFEFTNLVRQKTAEYILEKTDYGENISPSVVFEIVGESGAEELNEILLAGDSVFGSSNEVKYYKDCLKTLKISNLNQDILQLEDLFNNEPETQKRVQVAKLIQKKINQLNLIKMEDKE